jgi:hypothetical protein
LKLSSAEEETPDELPLKHLPPSAVMKKRARWFII